MLPALGRFTTSILPAHEFAGWAIAWLSRPLVPAKRLNFSLVRIIESSSMETKMARSPSEAVRIPTARLGRIEKRAGARSEPMWVAEILPDSAPLPLWRSLASLLPRLR